LRDGDPTRIGPYELHARLGEGGMGHAFLGRSPGKRLVAVKVVRSELAGDPAFRLRFAGEVAAARKVSGAYTAPVIDADTEGEPPWLATAYIPGPSLHTALTGRGPLPPETVGVLGAGLAEGLAAVHDCGIVHRDLKPANILLTSDGPRVIDFGIARAMDATSYTQLQPQTSTVLGTPAFMSPEQARGHEVAPASDVFSLGCVLACAATGRSPFGDGPAQAMLFRVVHEEPDLSGVPELIADVVDFCLAKDPAERPPPRDLLDELAALAPSGPHRPDQDWLPDDLTQVVELHRTRAQELPETKKYTQRNEQDALRRKVDGESGKESQGTSGRQPPRKPAEPEPDRRPQQNKATGNKPPEGKSTEKPSTDKKSGGDGSGWVTALVLAVIAGVLYTSAAPVAEIASTVFNDGTGNLESGDCLGWGLTEDDPVEVPCFAANAYYKWIGWYKYEDGRNLCGNSLTRIEDPDTMISIGSQRACVNEND
ncbi:MAG TPA: serine/threonine-protein kinase, partial [Actinomycetaceae bacterium]|nr:serine/threonine-protein kinase [Actinomycetaceae bacterium]